MKLKSLLLGSAAVFVAVSGARAADAIIVEPEPVEYVRVCDAYGAGWWYIPGTETCIKFDGDVRVEYRGTHLHQDWADGTSVNNTGTGTTPVTGPTDRRYLSDTFNDDILHQVRYRARLNVRANNETEYGTLASRIRFTTGATGGGQSAPTSDAFSSATTVGTGAAYVDWAVISLAGFKVGYADNYWTTAGGYGYYNGRHDGYYDYTQSVFLDYTWAANGWTATVGAETQYLSFGPTGSATGTPGQPDLYAGLTYSGSGWYLAGIYYYDSSAGDGAYKVRADYDFGNGFAIGGWFMADDGDTDYVHGHVWGVTAKMKLTDNLQLFGGYSSFSDQVQATCTYGNPGAGTVTTAVCDHSANSWTAGVQWDIVPGLYLLTEYTATTFNHEFGLPSATGNFSYQRNGGAVNVRIVRNF